MGNRTIAIALLALAALLIPGEALSQCSGQPPGNTVCAAPNGTAGLPRFRSLVAADLPGAAVSSVFARTGAVVAANGDYLFAQISGLLTLGQLPTIAGNSVFGNIGAGSTGVPVASCSGAANALTWTTGVGFGCNNITTGLATAITVGTTNVLSGTAGRILFNNGSIGEYPISGTGSVAMTQGPVFVTPTLGAATATSLTATTINGITTTGSGTVAFGTGGTVTYTIASGTAALGTAVIASAGCALAVTVAATGVLTTDVVTLGFNGDPTAVVGYTPAVTGMLTIIPYPTAGNVNFKVCNTTGSSITPGAITLNWRVVR